MQWFARAGDLAEEGESVNGSLRARWGRARKDEGHGEYISFSTWRGYEEQVVSCFEFDAGPSKVAISYRVEHQYRAIMILRRYL
jgi:hypothetical protein